MSVRHIVASGGGDDPVLLAFVAGLVDHQRPRVCFLPTASGDADGAVAAFYRAFPAQRFEPSDLTLFPRRIGDLRAHVLGQDIVFVGGGSTANMLALWRVHGLDGILREAWEAGVILAGVSAGASCWFEAFVTDSFGPDLAPFDGGLGLLAGSFCPHYDTEPGRRPLFTKLVGQGFPAGVGCDDAAALHFVGTELREVVAVGAGATAYRVEREATGSVSEEPLPARILGSP